MIKKYLNLYHLGLLYRSKTNNLQTVNEILDNLQSTNRDNTENEK